MACTCHLPHATVPNDYSSSATCPAVVSCLPLWPGLQAPGEKLGPSWPLRRSEGACTMTFEDAGRVVDKEITNLVKFLDKKVKPATKKEMAGLLQKASDRLSKLAKSLEEKA